MNYEETCGMWIS